MSERFAEPSKPNFPKIWLPVLQPIWLRTRDATGELRLLNGDGKLGDEMGEDGNFEVWVKEEGPPKESVSLETISEAQIERIVRVVVNEMLKKQSTAFSSITRNEFERVQKILGHKVRKIPHTTKGTAIKAFGWDEKREGDHENEYAKYMREHFHIPHAIIMCARSHDPTLLTCEPPFLPMKLSGGVDIAFILRSYEENRNPTAGIVLMIEVKKPDVMIQDDASCFRQTYVRHIADYLSTRTVTTVLTDLGEFWQFFFSERDSISSCVLPQHQAILAIQQLLALAVAADDGDDLVAPGDEPMQYDPFPSIKRQKKLPGGKISMVF